jgi:predicted nicotinamide N-methyase
VTLCQKGVGDVNCVVWDAALVLAKYLEAIHNDMQDLLRDRSVVGLGAGMECVGLIAA